MIWTRLSAFLALLVSVASLAAPPAGFSPDDVASADSTLPSAIVGTYWGRTREGWFWYRDPLAPPVRPETTPSPDIRPSELAEFEAMQRRLEDLKRIAVMNPSDANLVSYMRYQRFVMDKSELFADRWQRLVWTVPELDYSLTGRPTNSMAIGVFDQRQQEQQARTVRDLASTHALLFIFRSDCPYCHSFAPILKRFEQQFGMTVFAVSLDGVGLPEFPNPQMDNGIAARLNASVVPALYLTSPATRQIRPVGFGLMAMTDLVERISALGQDEQPSRNGPKDYR